MPYWGPKPQENDYAFDGVGMYISFITQRMFQDMETVLKKSYPEQGIVASLQILRIIGEQFPKNLSVHFRRKQFEQAKSGFKEWYDAVKGNLPSKYRESIWTEAMEEFSMFEEKILKRSSDK